MLALNGTLDVIEPFEIYQSFQTIPIGEAIDESRTMLELPADKITCDTNIQNTVWSVGQNVYEAAFHAVSLQDVDGRDIGERKRRRPSTAMPGHDELRDTCRPSLGMCN
jgi:hypothetical protein